MPNFHIELRTADRIWETLDIEHSDRDSLRIEMAKFVGELLKDHAAKIWEDRDWRVDVTDETEWSSTSSTCSQRTAPPRALPPVKPSRAAQPLPPRDGATIGVPE